jgi:internalin A
LVDISAVGELSKLKDLYVEKCKRLRDFSCLNENDSIEEIFISELDSIKFVSSMKEIKSLKFWDLQDGDISPVFAARSLKDVFFTPNKKHYTHTVQEVQTLLGKA